MRMTCHADLVFVRHRNHPIQKIVIFSQNASPSTCPAIVSGVFGCASLPLPLAASCVSSSRTRPVRSTPRMLMLYLIEGSPTRAQFRISS